MSLASDRRWEAGSVEILNALERWAVVNRGGFAGGGEIFCRLALGGGGDTPVLVMSIIWALVADDDLEPQLWEPCRSV